MSTVSAAPLASVTQPAPATTAPELAEDAGSWLPGSAVTLPDARLPPPTADRVREHLEAGDTTRALRDARRLAEQERWGRERDAAWMVVGVLEQEQDHHNLASEAFTRVRQADGPLAALASFGEAEEDLARGRPWATIQECERLVARWPADEHAEECLRLTAEAQAEVGQAGAARASAATYDEEHPKGPIGEQIELRLALRQADKDPEHAVPALVRLAIRHDAPLTGRTAERKLAELHDRGVEGAVLPDDVASREARALSLRDSGRRDEAWKAFQDLRTLGATDAAVARWVDDNEERFGWRCWRWDDLADRYGRLYAEAPSADTATDLYKALVRGSRFDEAATLALEMQKKWPTSSAWRRSQEDVGRTMMLAGRYDDAVKEFDLVAQRGGWTGRRGRFLGGFATLMAGRPEEAVTRLGTLVGTGGETELEARYWRARALDAIEQADRAEADRRWILEQDPWSWYATLLHQGDPDLPRVAPYARHGTWPGPRPEEVPLDPLALTALGASSPSLAAAALPSVAQPGVEPGAPGFAGWTWSWDGSTPLAPSPVEEEPSPLVPDGAAIPASYRASALFDPEAARGVLERFASANATDFPSLLEIADLASVGLYDLAGTRMSEFYEAQRKASRLGSARSRKLLAAPYETWTALFLSTRDHHHTARQVYGLWEDQTDPALVTEALRLGYPLAHDRFVWARGREHDVDPMMVLGLMRQESTYNATALSPAGARGAMQIMPRTGHLLADRLGDASFNAGDLEDPAFAVGYGIRYLGLLMERYEGVFPLAVASYNGGPHNVSAWLEGTGLDVPTDVFVEHIPFRETRDYVKKVSAGYAAYVALYAPPGSTVVVPPHPTGNHPDVVDF